MKKQLFFGLITSITFSCHADTSAQKRVLIATYVCQQPAILQEFLDSLSRLEKKSCTVDYYFIDANTTEESSRILINFTKEQTQSSCYLAFNQQISQLPLYKATANTLNEAEIWKSAHFKNKMIERVLTDSYDYLFLIDSNIVLHPKTLEHLLQMQKDIISEIFWTKWSPEYLELPSAWISDVYNLHENDKRESLSQEEIYKRQIQFLETLRTPGIYEVGGVRSCTLISKEVLKTNISFKKIKNLSFLADDAHFCIRAAALGIPLFIDTHYPAYNIHNETALHDVKNFIIANN